MLSSQVGLAQGTFNALTPSQPYTTSGGSYINGPYVAGYNNGGAGWTFTPTENLLVTSVSALFAQQVSVWLGTNTIMASYSIATPDGSLEPIAPLLLLAGQSYAISAQNTNSSSTQYLIGSPTGTPFTLVTVSSYLSGFGDYNLSPAGQWSPFASADNADFVSIGPNFQFQVAPEPGSLSLFLSGILLCPAIFKKHKLTSGTLAKCSDAS